MDAHLALDPAPLDLLPARREDARFRFVVDVIHGSLSPSWGCYRARRPDAVDGGRLLADLVSERRVGDRDERLGALAQADAAQVGDAVLGDDVVDVGAHGGDRGARARAPRRCGDTAPFFAVDGKAMIALPSRLRAAPRTKSTWPPMPVNWTGAHGVGARPGP